MSLRNVESYRDSADPGSECVEDGELADDDGRYTNDDPSDHGGNWGHHSDNDPQDGPLDR